MDSRNTWIISEYRMKTENLTHGSYKAVREVFCNILCFCEEWQGVVQVVFAKKDLVILQVKYTDSIDVHRIKYTRRGCDVLL